MVIRITYPNNGHGSRLRVVPHFSSGIVGRAKRERAWKSPHARKGDTRRGGRKMSRLFSRGVIFTRARVSLALLSLRKNGGLLVVYHGSDFLCFLLLMRVIGGVKVVLHLTSPIWFQIDVRQRLNSLLIRVKGICKGVTYLTYFWCASNVLSKILLYLTSSLIRIKKRVNPIFHAVNSVFNLPG